MGVGYEFDIPVRTFTGAHVHRAVHTGEMELSEHAHDWPHLVLHLLGSYREINADGAKDICSPGAVFHPPGHAHREEFGAEGAEVLILKFDPRWLTRKAARHLPDRPVTWTSGAVALAARALASNWLSSSVVSESDLLNATSSFFCRVSSRPSPPRPKWITGAHIAVEGANHSTAKLARELGLSCEWLARSYRTVTGEGLRETARRKKVERAIFLLRNSDAGLADVAIEAHFCDQSHLNRAVRALTGRTPSQIRKERTRTWEV